MSRRRDAAARWRALPLLLAGLLFVAALARDRVDAWIAATALPPLLPATSAEVLDREGRLLRAFTVEDGRWRLAVTPEAVDPTFRAMLVAYEDRRFARHPGVDVRALLRAAWQAARHGRVVSGGSTLTMQVARLTEDSGTGRLAGKIRQIRVALALERRLSKAEILALYLLRAPYGGNLEGIRAASLAWFGKEPRRLAPAEAALLVALPQAPEARRPDRHPGAARAARDRVLDRMARAGVLAPGAVAAARRAPVPTARRPFPAHAPHLSERLAAAGPGPHRTTLDRDLQATLQRLAADAARRAGPGLSAAILVADHRSGAVLARVGSAGYADDARAGWVDMTRAPRSPGSTLKPLVYALAFDLGLAHPDTLIADRPRDFGGYRPGNFDGAFLGDMRLREALQLSRNVPAVALAEAVGPLRLAARLRRAGAVPRLPGEGPPGLAVALGGVGLTLEELVRVQGALARGGLALPLHQTPGAPAAPRRVVSRAAAWQVSDILAGLPPPPHAPARPLAWKTGTSYGHRDAWAIGHDGAHVAGVWLGRADGGAVPGAFGAEVAAPLLFDTFARLGARPAPLPPPPPEALTAGPAALPPPLRRFGGSPGGVSGGPSLAFPPDGAEVETAGALALKVRDGAPPFTWLADGRPVATGLWRRETVIDAPGPGLLRLSVVDAEGRAARAEVTLRPTGRPRPPGPGAPPAPR